MYEDTKSVSGSLAVLFVALVFVYAVLFGVHGEQLTEYPSLEEIVDTDTGSAPLLPTQSEYESVVGLQVREAIDAASSVEESSLDSLEVTDSQDATRPATDLSPPPRDTPGRKFYSVQELFDQSEAQPPAQTHSRLALSGTHHRVGELQSLIDVKLGDDAQYILKDITNTHYVYLGDYQGSISDTVLQLGGNVVEIADENAINHHQLFGDEVWFLNLPDYQGIKVLMIVFFHGYDDARFLQIDYPIYYEHKSTLQDVFAQFYSR